MKYTDEYLDEFLKQMNVNFLPWQKELFKRLVNEPGKTICVSIPPRMGRGYFLEHLPMLMKIIKGEEHGIQNEKRELSVSD